MIRLKRSGRSLRDELEQLGAEIARTRAMALVAEATVDVQAALIAHNASQARRVDALEERRAALEGQRREARRLTRLERAELEATRAQIAVRQRRPLRERLLEMWALIVS